MQNVMYSVQCTCSLNIHNPTVSGKKILAFTAGEHQPWMNYENNGNEYLIIGAIVRSEYSNT